MKKAYLILLSLFMIGIGFHSCTKEDNLLADGDARDMFIGDWGVSDDCSKQSYRSTITYDPENLDQVQISNFANLNETVKAVVADLSIIIESQELKNGYTVSGYGTLSLNGKVITWTSHHFETDGEINKCTATYSLIE